MNGILITLPKALHLYFVASGEKPPASDLLESHVAADDLVNLVLRRQTNELRQLTGLNTEDGGAALTTLISCMSCRPTVTTTGSLKCVTGRTTLL